MTRLQQEYGPRGFQAIGVAFNPMANMLVVEYMRQFATGYPVGFASQDEVHSYLQVPIGYRMVVPQLIWIDKKGQIRAQSPPLGDVTFFEEKTIRGMIEKLLAEPATAAKKTAPAKKKGS